MQQSLTLDIASSGTLPLARIALAFGLTTTSVLASPVLLPRPLPLALTPASPALPRLASPRTVSELLPRDRLILKSQKPNSSFTGQKWYKVKSGDTCDKIKNQFNTFSTADL